MDDVAEALESVADKIEDPKKINRRTFLRNVAVAAGGRVIEGAFGLPPNSDVRAAGESLVYPFAGLDRNKVIQALKSAQNTEVGNAGMVGQRLIGELGSSNGQFTDFAYGNPTPYGDIAKQIYRNIRPSFPDSGISDEFAEKELLVAPNLFYFNQDLRNMFYEARDEALRAAGMNLDDLRAGRWLPEKYFSASVQRRYNEIDAKMRSMRGEQLIFAVVKPTDGTYFMEGPYWKANSSDISKKSEWEVQYARPVIIGDVKSAFHMYNCTPELTGLREGNFLADLMPGLYRELKAYRNDRHRPLCMLLKP